MKSDLTRSQWGTVISRFKSSVYRLKESGDYPEKKEDNYILRRLIGFQWEEIQREEKGDEN